MDANKKGPFLHTLSLFNEIYHGKTFGMCPAFIPNREHASMDKAMCLLMVWNDLHLFGSHKQKRGERYFVGS